MVVLWPMEKTHTKEQEMREPVVDIVDRLISGLVFSEPILKCVVLGDEVEITVKDTHRLVSGSTFTVGGDEFVVKKIVDSSKILIDGNTCLVGDVVIGAPNYFHGTVKATTQELDLIKSNKNKVPMGYLFEVLREKRNRNPEDVIDRRADLIIFFLEDADYKRWLTDDYYSDAIIAMDNLAEDFIDTISDSSEIGCIERDDYMIIPHAKYGYIDKNGHTKNLFNMQLAGVELRVTLPIKSKECKC